jgi:hypothetical protein
VHRGELKVECAPAFSLLTFAKGISARTLVQLQANLFLYVKLVLVAGGCSLDAIVRWLGAIVRSEKSDSRTGQQS